MSRTNTTIFVAGLAAGAAVLLGAAPALAAREKVDFYPGDLGQAIATLATFVVLLWILGRYAWRPIVTQLQRREKRIADALGSAEKRERKARELEAHYESRLESIQAEADQIVVRSREQAQAIRQEAVEAGREEAEAHTRRAQEDIEAARQTALRELHETTARLATDVAGRVLRKTLRPEDHQQLLAESLEEIRERAARRP